jgi:hypothetical protein
MEERKTNIVIAFVLLIAIIILTILSVIEENKYLASNNPNTEIEYKRNAYIGTVIDKIPESSIKENDYYFIIKFEDFCDTVNDSFYWSKLNIGDSLVIVYRESFIDNKLEKRITGDMMFMSEYHSVNNKIN